MTNLEQALALIKNDKAKAKVKYLNKQADIMIQTGKPADQNLAAYKRYYDKFMELKKKYPNWSDHLGEPIEYSYFINDYNEDIMRSLKAASPKFKNLEPEEIYAFNIHGVNEVAIEILREKLGQLDPGSKWTNPEYFNSHIKEAFTELRLYYPEDADYDNIFSPKEEIVYWG